MSNQQRAALRYLAAGYPPSQVSQKLRGVSLKRLKTWLKDPEFIAAIAAANDSIDTEMHDLLV